MSIKFPGGRSREPRYDDSLPEDEDDWDSFSDGSDEEDYLSGDGEEWDRPPQGIDGDGNEDDDFWSDETEEQPEDSGRDGRLSDDGWLRDPYEDEDEDGFGGRAPRAPRRRNRPWAVALAAAIIAVVAIRSGARLLDRKESAAAPMVTQAPTAQPTAASTAVPAMAPTSAPTPTPVPAPANADHSLEYCRSLLDAGDQAVYDAVYTALFHRQPEVGDLHCGTFENAWKIVTYVQNDHPELYYWERGGTGWETSPGVFKLDLNYSFTEAQIASAQATLDSIVEFLRGSYGRASEYDKVKAVYEYIINNTDYVANKDDQTIYGVLVNHRGVCCGYSRSTQYLLHQLGMECLFVWGSAGDDPNNADGHDWNIVKIDGEWYQLDTTWGDPVQNDGSPGSDLRYEYFCLTTDEMLRDHFILTDYPLPYCTATAANYYVHEGRWFAQFDRQGIYDLLRRDYAAGRPCEFRLGSDSAYREAFSCLVDNWEISQAIPGLNNYIFSANEAFNVIVFYFT